MTEESTLSFSVFSSSPGVEYKIVAHRSAGRLRLSCECEAAENGMHCKHRIGLLIGEITALASGNGDDVATLGTWLSGTPLEASLSEVAALEREAEVVKRRLSQAKKRLGKVLLTGTSP